MEEEFSRLAAFEMSEEKALAGTVGKIGQHPRRYIPDCRISLAHAIQPGIEVFGEILLGRCKYTRIRARYIPHLEAVMIYRNDRFLRGGDHTPWVENGYAAVRITEMNEDYRHQHQNVRSENGVQYGDLPEFIDFDYLRKNTALNLATLASLAKSPPPPQEVSVEVRALTNATELSWNAPRAGKPKGYYVLMRETTSPVWQTKLFTAATEVRLPWSKDNYFFAVQSVGEQGDEGLPVIPAVRR